jgi:heterodisulfide reductase subunit A-like polyferredoxin
VNGTPRTRLEAAYGVTEQALARHEAKHLPITLVRAASGAEDARAADLLDQAKRLQVETWQVLEAAKAEGNLAGVLAAVDRAQKGLALLGTMLSPGRAANAIAHGGEIAAELPEWVQAELRALGERYATNQDLE